MKNRLKAFWTLLGLSILQLQSFAQTPNFSGTWVLNLAKSQLEHKPDGLTSSVFVIKQEGDKFRLTRYHIFGDKKKKISFKMTADGKTRPVKILFKGKLENKENSLLATIWGKNFSNIVNYKNGANQHEFIADEVFTGLPQNHHNIWVFDRELQD
ncbi:conserved exported hypothetical protein [Imperialibacter sp. EC-SDR9]|uniref:hypothetical protein n=1 Tax=Imperialibacter sp. EC-SDR9 TaxID=2038371 RepID=UPI0012569948|nr:hypothetical protein [Imperialibacter sp. EC-SDR9]CAD5250676.1 conserved exported hypothetical protein [Imperialibacter sp. 75]CAD5286059.1 conserved exported hypothetical protein [Imperialibacter sp. 89]VVT05231.1 conserved exported hypothetical protein [Imperialibacter sp. EC-SDR9]